MEDVKYVMLCWDEDYCAIDALNEVGDIFADDIFSGKEDIDKVDFSKYKKSQKSIAFRFKICYNSGKH